MFTSISSEVIVVIIVKNTIRYFHDWFIVMPHPSSDCQRADFKVTSQQTTQLYNIPQMSNLKKLRLENQPTTRRHKNKNKNKHEFVHWGLEIQKRGQHRTAPVAVFHGG